MRKLKKLGIFLGTVILFFLIINIIPPSKAVENNPFIIKDGEKTMLAAHRGGADTNPENTMKAFKSAVNEYQVDILESDLYLTKDGYLVYNHDEYIDETCDVNEDMSLEEVEDMIDEDASKAHYIKDYTLEELRQFNFGHFFEDKNGNMPYHNLVSKNQENRLEVLKENGLQIVEMSELFDTFYQANEDLLFIVEIKNEGDNGKKAVDQLVDVLENKYPNYKNQIVVGTFHPEIEDYLKESYPSILRGASTKGAAGFVITEMFKVNIFNNNNFACLQIPMEYEIKGIEINLDKKMYIKRAHRRNIAVQYWTINNEEDMKRLIDLGCDAIMSDDLEVCRRVIDTYSPK